MIGRQRPAVRLLRQGSGIVRVIQAEPFPVRLLANRGPVTFINRIGGGDGDGYSLAVSGADPILIPATQHRMARVRAVFFWDSDGWEQSILSRRLPNGDVLIYTDGQAGTVELL